MGRWTGSLSCSGWLAVCDLTPANPVDACAPISGTALQVGNAEKLGEDQMGWMDAADAKYGMTLAFARQHEAFDVAVAAF